MEWLQQGCKWRFGSRFFSTLALMIFLLKFLLKNAPKSSFSPLRRRDPVLELQFLLPLRVVLLRFSADGSGMAASRFLNAAAACVMPSSFAAERHKS